MGSKKKPKQGPGSFAVIFFCLSCLASLAFFTLYFRPLWPIDETRYLSVAWEMWDKKSFIVPYLNGTPYSHKPPILFWTIHIGWAIFGVNEWWPRIIPFIFGFLNMLLIRKLAEAIFGKANLKDLILLTLFGHLIFIFFSTVVMFDMVLLSFVILSYLFTVKLLQNRANLFLLGISMGLGVLTKGPVMFLHVLPISILLPWIYNFDKKALKTYYMRLLYAVGISVLLSLAWAIPASVLGGETFRKEILWGQTAGRISKSFAHQAPWWYYLAYFPVLLLPWTFAIVRWLGSLKNMRNQKENLLCIILIIAELVLFSLISGKQIFYILPAIIPASLLLSNSLKENTFSQVEFGFICAFYFILGLFMAFTPYFAYKYVSVPTGFKHIKPYYGIGLSFVALTSFLVMPKRLLYQLFLICLEGVICFLLLLAGPINSIAKEYDLKDVSSYLFRLESQGYRLFHVGKYHGEYHFLGRLKGRIQQIEEQDVRGVLKEPKAAIIWVAKDLTRVPSANSMYLQTYAGKYLYILGNS